MKPKGIVGLIILAIIIIVPLAFGLLGDYYWFLSLGWDDVFVTILSWKVIIGLAAGLGFLVFSIANIRVAAGKGRKPKELYGLAAVLSLLLGLGFSAGWETVLKWVQSTPFAGTDPVFGLNIGFFAFELPFLSYVFSYALSLVFLTFLLTVVSLIVRHRVPSSSEELVDELSAYPKVDWKGFKKKAVPHLSFLLGLLFFVISFGFVLGQWSLVLSPTGTVFGAGYTDLNVTLPLLSILTIVTAVIGLALIANTRLKRLRLPIEGIAAFLIILILGFGVAGVVQAIVVAPNEFNLEKPYIERNIKATLDAYNLDKIEEGIFDVSYNLSYDDIINNADTINNIRLWDFRPLIQTYNQLQLFRTYYDFNDVDIDRYIVGNETKQVMVSAREIDTGELPKQARTWVNRHLVYTHGYGIVMNPVDDVTEEGLPEFIIKDIPPQSLMPLERNEIYFGESDLDFAIIKTTTEELDYPKGNENAYTTYQGKDGIALGPILNRLIYAVQLRSPELLFSGSIQQDSKLLMKRNIIDRVQTLAPFLTYDADPYIVLSEGHFFWILDAYTTSQSYPYSQPFAIGFFDDINYARNSVKVVVDAYDGNVWFYVIDQDDPIIQTYRKIFPSLFTAFEEMPSSLKAHVRYPEGLFRIQAHIYSTYHMEDPRVFYNKEDIWVNPEEVYRGTRQEMIPYYIIMRLPGESSEEFILMLPFVPRGKDNLIGWMAARSDGANYGKLTVFRFSKQELIYGPLQIEARIDQNTDISALFTLWSQAGSSVIRGNTLVIPIEDSILYIEPVFLEATEKGTLPQLKRVIVAYGNRLTMQPTLQGALDVIFGIAPEEPTGGVTAPEGTPEEVLEQVATIYQDAQDALKAGDLKEYARIMEQIGEILEKY
ncbi:MAG: UPF0182 family protein [Candidatus Aenigmarchaeota archaeon]|nr:UPF0182 family protein [Candidatus Aenigmarchaeota archaeon]